MLTQEVLHAPAEIEAARRAALVEYDETRPGLDLLWVMEWVVSRPKGQDKSQAQKECRKWLEEDRRGFMGKLADLKKAAGKEETKSDMSDLGSDEGSERAGQLAEELLRGWADE